MLERLAAVEQQLRARPDVLAGTVRVATVYSVGLHTLPRVIKRCLAEHPQVNVRLSYRRTNEVSAACLDGEVDFGIVALVPREPRQLAMCRSATTSCSDGAADTRDARRARCPIAALHDQPFIGSTGHPDAALRRRPAPASRRARALRAGVDNVETIKRSSKPGSASRCCRRPRSSARSARARWSRDRRRGSIPPADRRHLSRTLELSAAARASSPCSRTSSARSLSGDSRRATALPGRAERGGLGAIRGPQLQRVGVPPASCGGRRGLRAPGTDGRDAWCGGFPHHESPTDHLCAYTNCRCVAARSGRAGRAALPTRPPTIAPACEAR